MRAEIRPFEEAHLGEAGSLLAARHRRHRAARPLLSEQFEDSEVATAEVAAAWALSDSSGAVAVVGGRLVGYVVGAPRSSPLWGPHVWVEAAGQAVSGEADVMRDLYGAAATRWVDEGRTVHYVLTPSYDADLVAAWFRVGFGHQHTHAVRRPLEGSRALRPGLTVRAARREDIPVMAQLDVELPHHQSLSPCFSPGEQPTLESAAAELEEEFDDPEFPNWVAVHDGSVIGAAVGCDLGKSSINGGLVRPDNAGFLGYAAVLPEARGLGAGRALGETVLAWAAEQEYDVVATDWRQTNLLSSRAWPALGFEDTFWRLHRTIGY